MAAPRTEIPASNGVDVVGRQRRLAATLRALVEAAPLPADAAGVAELSALALRWDTEVPDSIPLETLAAEVDEAQGLVTHRLLSQPLLAARRVNMALERIQAASSFSDVLRAAPAELCWAGDFDRVLLSRVEGSTWIPAAWHVDDVDSPASLAFGKFIKDTRIEMSSGMIEAEIVRRRIPALVADARGESRTYAPLVDIALSTAYLVAPIVFGDEVVGLLHADTRSSGRRLVESDRTTLRAFADGLGLTLERLALMDRLRLQRQQIADALASAARSVDELCVAPVRLARPSDGSSVPAPTPIDGPPDDGFTAREREVFAILVSGATNAQIADRLTVSETTVKSHVKHILRKLRASNRAEAIALYLATNHRGRGGS